jgi:hypothetical protein
MPWCQEQCPVVLSALKDPLQMQAASGRGVFTKQLEAINLSIHEAINGDFKKILSGKGDP